VKHILKLLKKLTIPVLFLIIMLFLQALCDLSLPEYTANIINVGIQQGGIENIAPIVLTEKTYENILMVTEEDQVIENAYSKISKSNLSKEEYKEYQKQYPLLKNEDLYILKDLEKDRINDLENVITEPFIIASNLDEIKEVESSSINAMQELDESFIKQYAINSIKAEYTNIGINLNKIQMNYILNNGLIMIGIAAIGMIIAISIGFVASRAAGKFSYMLREKVIRKIMSFSSKEFKEFSIASLITRSTNDIQQIQQLFMMFIRVVIFAPILGIGALLKIWGSEMSWVIALGIALLIVLIATLFTFVLPKFKLVQSLVDKLNLITREVLTGMPVIRAFATEKHEEKRLDKANLDLSETHLHINRIMSIMSPSINLIMNCLSILIIWIGAKQVDLGTMQVGTLLAFIVYTMQVISSFLMLSMVSIVLPRAWISVKRVAEILNTESSIVDSKNPIKFDNSIKGEIEFKDVYFKYPDAEEYILENLNFKIKKGTTTAFIGSTGSGKSTLINLIPRFFDVTKGEILVDGKNIKDVKIKDLREKIGYVPQTGILFTGSIESNLKFGNDNLADKQIKKAARIAQAESFINSKDKKYKSSISQGGTNVSGGQKQRLSIARAVAINPEFYIFDDSFSALDFKTDVNLRKALANETKDSTILIVAQRISTIMNADQIIVLDEGKVVGIGKHKDLLKKCKVYKEIALSQLREEELNA